MLWLRMSATLSVAPVLSSAQPRRSSSGQVFSSSQSPVTLTGIGRVNHCSPNVSVKASTKVGGPMPCGLLPVPSSSSHAAAPAEIASAKAWFVWSTLFEPVPLRWRSGSSPDGQMRLEQSEPS